MNISKGKRAALRSLILTLLVAIGLPGVALADPPQGRGQGRGKSKISKQEKKNAKFKKIYEPWKQFRQNQNQWYSVSELPIANFLVSRK